MRWFIYEWRRLHEDVDTECVERDGPIEAAIEDLLAYRDYLILEDAEIVFDKTYAREGEEW